MSWLSLTRTMAGRPTLIVGDVAFHFFPAELDRSWGHATSWYDGTLHWIGVGPFLLICWGPR